MGDGCRTYGAQYRIIDIPALPGWANI
jgi:hypothetical protein